MVGSAIILGPLGAWQLPARYTARSTAFVPAAFWPAAVRSAVVDALADALVRDATMPPCEPSPEERPASVPGQLGGAPALWHLPRPARQPSLPRNRRHRSARRAL